MKATVHLTDPEEHLPVEVDARDRRAFERVAKRELGAAAQGHLKDVINNIPETYVCWMAWHALTVRTRASTLSWQDFDNRVVEVEMLEDADEMDPTQPGVTGG